MVLTRLYGNRHTMIATCHMGHARDRVGCNSLLLRRAGRGVPRRWEVCPKNNVRQEICLKIGLAYCVGDGRLHSPRNRCDVGS